MGYLEVEKNKKMARSRSVTSSEHGQIIVTIMEGIDLHPSDVSGYSDPYCLVNIGNQEHKTKVIPKTLHPKWGTKMLFNIRDPETDRLCITIYDHDMFSPDDFLGRTEVPVSQIIQESTPGKPITKRLLLHEVPTGEVVVTLEVDGKFF